MDQDTFLTGSPSPEEKGGEFEDVPFNLGLNFRPANVAELLSNVDRPWSTDTIERIVRLHNLVERNEDQACEALKILVDMLKTAEEDAVEHIARAFLLVAAADDSYKTRARNLLKSAKQHGDDPRYSYLSTMLSLFEGSDLYLLHETTPIKALVERIKSYEGQVVEPESLGRGAEKFFVICPHFADLRLLCHVPGYDTQVISEMMGSLIEKEGSISIGMLSAFSVIVLAGKGFSTMAIDSFFAFLHECSPFDAFNCGEALLGCVELLESVTDPEADAAIAAEYAEVLQNKAEEWTATRVESGRGDAFVNAICFASGFERHLTTAKRAVQGVSQKQLAEILPDVFAALDDEDWGGLITDAFVSAGLPSAMLQKFYEVSSDKVQMQMYQVATQLFRDSITTVKEMLKAHFNLLAYVDPEDFESMLEIVRSGAKSRKDDVDSLREYLEACFEEIRYILAEAVPTPDVRQALAILTNRLCVFPDAAYSSDNIREALTGILRALEPEGAGAVFGRHLNRAKKVATALLTGRTTVEVWDDSPVLVSRKTAELRTMSDTGIYAGYGKGCVPAGVMAAHMLVEYCRPNPAPAIGILCGSDMHSFVKELGRMGNDARGALRKATFLSLGDVWTNGSEQGVHEEFLRRELLAPLGIPQSRLKCASENFQACDQQILDIAIIGIADCGWLGLNPPGQQSEGTGREVTLNEDDKKRVAKFFRMPAPGDLFRVYSAGTGTYMTAEKLVFVSDAKTAPEWLLSAVRAKPHEKNPATKVQEHNDVMVVLTQDAAAELEF